MCYTALMQELYDLLPTLDRDDPLRTMAASVSPLLLAMHRDSSIFPYPHMQYLDQHVLALTNLQLYPDGPGPPPEVFGRKTEGRGDYLPLGAGYDAATSDEAFNCHEILLLRPGTDPNVPFPAEDEVVTRLAIAMPPRHGKSMLVTENLPLWYMLRHPTSSIVVSTYNQDFADKWGASAREHLSRGEGGHYTNLPLASDGYPLLPSEGTRSDISFRTGKDVGEIHYRGFRGQLTGTGWNLGIIDDPFKDHEDAHSPTIRKMKQEWYSSVFRSRTTRKPGCPPALEIMMFTRWHEDDLAGHFAYEEDGETPAPGWHVLRLAALAEDNDPLGREQGASLCPALSPRSFLLTEQKQDPTVFSCLYQGNPSHSEGALFAKPYIHYTGTEEGFCRQGDHLLIPTTRPLYFVTVDLAASLKTQADFSVASYWAWDAETGVLVLVDSQRERISTEKHAAWLDRFIQRQGIAPDFVGIEDKSFGTNLINEMRMSHPHFVLVPLKAIKDKYSRALPYAEAVKAGKVWFPSPDAWPGSVTWENEHSRFPNVKHDDQVDTGAYAWAKTRDYTHVQPVEAEWVEPSASDKAWAHLEAVAKKKRRGGFAKVLGSM